MKVIGKVAVLAMALGVVVALTACGGSAPSSSASSSASASASSAAASASASSSAASSASGAASASSEEATEYTNDYFGIAYILPQGFSFADANSMAAANAQVSAATQGAKIDMAAASADKTATVILALEEGNTQGADAAEKHLESEAKELTDSVSGSNVECTSESSTATFGGATAEMPCNVTTIKADGGQVVIIQVCMAKDGAFCDILAMGTTEEAATNALAGFKHITA